MTELQTESPCGDTREDDVACADCGAYRTLYGPLRFGGDVVEGGDYVCRRCAERRGADIGAGDTPEQQYVLYELESGERELHGGPYPPMKAREVRQAMVRQIDSRGDAWRIPDEAVDVVCVPQSVYGSEERDRDE